MTSHIFDSNEFPQKILKWYDLNARELPWRSKTGEKSDPYKVWLSEIMLQQTTVQTVGPYFEKFTANWPTVKHLALAPLDDVLSAWAGLGYYARARNLHKCAGEVWHNYGGEFPDTEAELLKLPGVGPYTAAAIASIAFEEPAVVVDGNVERIISRVFKIEEELPKSRPEIREKAALVTPQLRPGDYAQALMDIGSSVCKPKSPKCGECPVTDLCILSGDEAVESYPKKAPKKQKPVKAATVFWFERDDGSILMRRRPEKGLLGGMMEFPSIDWLETELFQSEKSRLEAELLSILGVVGEADKQTEVPHFRHTFTHFHLDFHPRAITFGEGFDIASNELVWIHPEKFEEHALPTLMMKVAKAVIEYREADLFA